jgi:hypothetical protein
MKMERAGGGLPAGPEWAPALSPRSGRSGQCARLPPSPAGHRSGRKNGPGRRKRPPAQIRPELRHALQNRRSGVTFRTSPQGRCGAQAETARTRTPAARLSGELASRTAGSKQGREDVIPLMPLILAQATPAAAAGPTADTETAPEPRALPAVGPAPRLGAQR